MREIAVTGSETVAELADLMEVSVTQVVTTGLKSLGLLLTIGERLDFERIHALAGAFGIRAVRAGPEETGDPGAA